MRARFDVEGYLDENLGILSRSIAGDGHVELVCECPFCGKARKLWVNSSTGRWTCYRCGESGGAIKLVAEVEGISHREAVKRFLSQKRKPRALSEITETEQKPEKRPDPGLQLPAEYEPVFNETTRAWAYPVYLKIRGVRARTAVEFRLGLCRTGRYANRVILPSYVFGELRAFQGRATGPFEPRYLGPALPKKSVLFGLDQALGARTIVVVEGPFDVLNLYRLGIPSVALMGKLCSPGQAALLVKAGFRESIVMLDGKTTREPVEVARMIDSILPARIARLPFGLDPGEATAEQAHEALATSSSISFRSLHAG